MQFLVRSHQYMTTMKKFCKVPHCISCYICGNASWFNFYRATSSPTSGRRGCRGMRSLCNCMCRRNVRTPTCTCNAYPRRRTIQLTRTHGRHYYTAIKADRPFDTLNAPWLLTDNSNGLAMVIRNYHWLNSASRVLISTCSAPLVQKGERKQTHKWTDGQYYCLTLTFDIRPWPTIQAGQAQGQPSCQKSRLNIKRFKQESTHRQTDGHTDATKRIISPAMRSIIISQHRSRSGRPTCTDHVATIIISKSTWRAFSTLS